MTAYVVVHLTPKNAEKAQAYAAAAGPTVAAHGGKFLTRGPSETLAGEHAHKAMAVIEFPSRELARQWYASPEYQATIALRTEGLDSVFILGGE